MQRTITIIAITALLFSSCESIFEELRSTPDTLNETTIDIEGTENVTDFIRTSDNGYAILGGRQATIFDVNQFFYKTNDNLDIEFEIKLQGFPNEIIETSDKGYLVHLNYFDSSQVYMTQIQKFDSKGLFLWEVSLGDSGVFYTRNLIEDSEANIYLNNLQNLGPDRDSSINELIKLDCHGNIIWQKSFEIYSIKSLLVLNDGNILIIGNSLVSAEDNSEIKLRGPAYMLKINPNGEKIWEKSLPKDDSNSGEIAIEDNSGNIFLCGRITITTIGNFFRYGVFLDKLDSSGNIIWEKTYEQLVINNISSLIIDKNESILVGGNSFDSSGAWVFLVNSRGKIQWNYEDNSAWLNSVFLPDSDNYILAGTKFIDLTLKDDIWISTIGF